MFIIAIHFVCLCVCLVISVCIAGTQPEGRVICLLLLYILFVCLVISVCIAGTLPEGRVICLLLLYILFVCLFVCLFSYFCVYCRYAA